jgi:hypothetical protein
VSNGVPGITRGFKYGNNKVLNPFHVESSTSDGTWYVNESHSCYISEYQAYVFLLSKLENRVTDPTSTLILVDAVGP